jgi:hypothetical protein
LDYDASRRTMKFLHTALRFFGFLPVEFRSGPPAGEPIRLCQINKQFRMGTKT